MKKSKTTIIAIFAIFFTLGCQLLSPNQVQPFSQVENRIYITGNGLSFELPNANWDSKSSKYQEMGSLDVVSFTRTQPISFGNGQAYYPTMTIITEELSQKTDPKAYDELIRKSVEDLGMVIEILDALTPDKKLLPEINGVGWKVLVHTKKGDSMGYIIHIVNQQTGIRFILESTPENFDTMDQEYIEIIKSIKVE
ncbi:MAG: hypothetical protein QM730_31030 [Anaerolineales bacterium]